MDSLPKSGTIEARGQRSDGSIFPLEIAASQAVEEASMTTVIARDMTAQPLQSGTRFFNESREINSLRLE